MNKFLLIIPVILIFSCSITDHIPEFEAEMISDGRMYADFSFDFNKPLNFEKNLKMFSSAEMGVKIEIYDGEKSVCSENILRNIKYDRWNDLYSIKDSFSGNERTFNDFQSLISGIYDFSDVPLKVNSKGKRFLLKYDFYFKTVDFVQPFKFIEFYIKTDNIQSKNNKKYFYVKNN